MSSIITLLLAAATASSPSPPVTTLQQEFDAASAAEVAGDCARAVPLFEALERRPGGKPGSLSAAAISVRKGKCLVQQGRTAEGENAIVAGLPALERAGSNFDVDVGAAYRALGDAALNRADFAQAKERYTRAYALQVPQLRLAVLAGLVKATSFDPGPEPLAYADEGLRFAESLQPPSKDFRATFHTLKARVLLNRGETEAGYAELMKALSLSGGLTLQNTTLAEASMRGDLALAAMLLNRKEDARKYLAYTGAGRISASPFAVAVSMSPPDCGEETGLRPDDFAVVEFGIAADGSVSSAQTVYSRGGPAVAAAFANAVKKWYWMPEALAKIPPFYRLATRVELRCTSAGGPAPNLTAPLAERFGQWAMPRLRLGAITDQAQLIAKLRSDAADSSQDPATQIARIGMLAFLDRRVNADRLAMLGRAVSLAGPSAAPGEVVNTLRILKLLLTPLAAVPGRYVRSGRLDQQGVLLLLNDRVIAGDPLAASTLRLLADSRTTDLIRQAAEDARLPEHHPLRQMALLTLANRAASSGDLAGAQAFFTKTGLTEQQCALIGPRPALRRSGADSSDFPREAMMYGFEGWVHLEFDITSDGKATNARPVIAYPPFVFVDAAKGMTRGIRYEASYRPAGGMACSANAETIRFILP